MVKNERLTYQINFSNIGLGPAGTVSITDTLDTDLNLDSLYVISGSHPYTYTLNGRILQVTFMGINLMPGQSGNIRYRIRPLASVPEGTVILNSASIRFDDLPPIQTAMVRNTIVQSPEPIALAGQDKTIYVGYTPGNCVSLQASAIGGQPPYNYWWSSGQTTASITVCPTATTIYTLTVGDAGGNCFGADQVVVNVVDVRCGSKGNKVRVCESKGSKMKRKEKCVGPSKVASILGKGGNLGPCPAAKWDEPETESLEFTVQTVPNPFRNETVFRVFTRNTSSISIEVFSMEGKKIWNINQLTDGEEEYVEIPFSVEGLPSGMFLYKVSDAAGNQTFGKLIKAE